MHTITKQTHKKESLTSKNKLFTNKEQIFTNRRETLTSKNATANSYGKCPRQNLTAKATAKSHGK